MALERSLEGRDQLLKLVKRQAREIQERHRTGLQLGEPYTCHGSCLLSRYGDVRGVSYQKESGINSNVPLSARGHRVTTSHSSGPVRLRSSRVCTRRVTSSMPTGPFSPSRTVTWAHAAGASAWCQIVIDCYGGFGGLPRSWYTGFGASRSRMVVVQGISRT